MLHQTGRTTITLEPDNLLELEQVITDEDHDQAFEFLKVIVYSQVVRTQKAYDPQHGTIGHRRNKFGYGHISEVYD